jgi:hypothetical protein
MTAAEFPVDGDVTAIVGGDGAAFALAAGPLPAQLAAARANAMVPMLTSLVMASTLAAFAWCAQRARRRPRVRLDESVRRR